MPSVVEDFAFIAKRAHEIRAARYHELGVSPPSSPQPPPHPVEETTLAAQASAGGFRYAPGFEHLAHPQPIDDGCGLSTRQDAA